VLILQLIQENLIQENLNYMSWEYKAKL